MRTVYHTFFEKINKNKHIYITIDKNIFITALVYFSSHKKNTKTSLKGLLSLTNARIIYFLFLFNFNIYILLSLQHNTFNIHPVCVYMRVFSFNQYTTYNISVQTMFQYIIIIDLSFTYICTS